MVFMPGLPGEGNYADQVTSKAKRHDQRPPHQSQFTIPTPMSSKPFAMSSIPPSSRPFSPSEYTRA
jgi:hypothetical protein